MWGKEQAIRTFLDRWFPFPYEYGVSRIPAADGEREKYITIVAEIAAVSTPPSLPLHLCLYLWGYLCSVRALADHATEKSSVVPHLHEVHSEVNADHISCD